MQYPDRGHERSEARRRLLALLRWHAHGLQAFSQLRRQDRKSTRLNPSHSQISYAVFCLKKKKNVSPIRSKSLFAFSFSCLSKASLSMVITIRSASSTIPESIIPADQPRPMSTLLSTIKD